MITLHKLGHGTECFSLNPDLIVSIEATPDTVITLATTSKVLVAERPEEVAEAVRSWRAAVIASALRPEAPTLAPGSRAGRTVAGATPQAAHANA
ncbi:MAG TPA: flagellar FlbD family protein [Solirubrobacteraceae bacterium]|nr:flagellar FlbD family protein [Solirubrobacteraceae bacterium]